MTEIAKWMAWINKDDSEQHEWACEYLNKKGMGERQEHPFSNLVSPYHSLVIRSKQWEPTETFIDLMRRAWAQEKHRKARKGKTAVNLVLSTAAKSELARLAKTSERNITETLELLIIQQKDREEEHRAERKKAREDQEKRYKKLQAAQTNAIRAAMEIRDQLDACLLELTHLTAKLQERNPEELTQAERITEVRELYRRKRIEVANSPALATARLLRLMNTFFADPDEKHATNLSEPEDGVMGLA